MTAPNGSPRYEEGNFTAFDGLKLFYRVYEPPARSNQFLLILHGKGEHTGRYQPMVDWLYKQGLNFTVALFDYRGHGLSQGREVYAESFQDYLKDVSSFLEFLGARTPLPASFYLMGNSLGGLIAVHWAAANRPKVKHLILTAPCLGIKLPAPILLMNKVLNFICPKLIYRNPVYPPYLTHAPEEVQKYRSDPLIRRKISVRLLQEMLDYAELVQTGKWRFEFPVSVLLPDLEKIVDPKKTQQFYESLTAPRKRIFYFENFYHEIFHEAGKEKAYLTLVGLLKD